jgi:hypothetical protein
MANDHKPLAAEQIPADGCAAAGRSSCFSLSVNAFPGQQWRIGFAPLNLMAGEKAVNDEVRDLYIYSF